MGHVQAFLWISLGAVFGANLRYFTTLALARWLGPRFPYGTLAVNLLGSILVGVAGTMVLGRLIDRPDLVRLVVIVGFLGSLTTFSAFTYETHELLDAGAWMPALANVLVSVIAGVAGVRLGIALTPRIAGLM